MYVAITYIYLETQYEHVYCDIGLEF